MLTIDDFVMLGKTVPEPNSDGRVFVCSAGVSATMRGLIRVYPLARHGTPARWSINTIALERNPKDSRPESFKLAGDRTPGQHDNINATIQSGSEVSRHKRVELLKPYAVDSIKEANGRRLSLALIHPDSLELTFDHNPDSPNSPELTLFDVDPRPTEGAKRFAYIPRMHFRDTDGEHHLMLRDWGCYEFMRKQGDDRRQDLGDALHLDNSCSLLVGNFNQHRTSWLIISVLRGLRCAPSLFDEQVAS
jgi:hypothetical protein